jgi:tRNA(adenine34) deaminase
MSASGEDTTYLRRAIELAREAERCGNLPIGALVCLDGEIIAQGMNSIWQPVLDMTRHAEMEALRSVPAHLWSRAREMTLFTTLEPYLPCTGAILLHQIGRLVFGALDPYGGVGVTVQSLPPYFREQFLLIEWIGPALPAECDPLYTRVRELEQARERLCPSAPPDTWQPTGADRGGCAKIQPGYLIGIRGRVARVRSPAAQLGVRPPGGIEQHVFPRMKEGT